jgi:hypothetical protein
MGGGKQIKSIGKFIKVSRSRSSATLPSPSASSSTASVGSFDPQPSNPANGAAPMCDHPHDGKEVANMTIDLSAKEIHDLMYAGSKYLVKFLDDRKTTNVKIGPLKSNSDGRKGRTATFTVPLGMGALNGDITQLDVSRACADHAAGLYSIDVHTTAANVPYSDSFYVSVHYCVRQLSPNQSQFAIYASIVYTKSVRIQ